jgi:hypothetical protein
MPPVRRRRPVEKGALRLGRRTAEDLQDYRNLRFGALYHAPDTWLNGVVVVVFLIVIFLGMTNTWPFAFE